MSDFDSKFVPEVLARRFEMAAQRIRHCEPRAVAVLLDSVVVSLSGATWDGGSVEVFTQACETSGLEPAEEIERVYRAVGARNAPAKAEERTGLPCEDCGKKQRRVGVDRLPDGSLTVRLSTKLAPEEVAKGVKDIIKLLKMFLPH